MPFWESTPFWGIAGLIGGIIISALFFLIGRKRMMLEYHIFSTQWISETATTLPGLEVTMNNVPVKNLYLTRVAFYNRGNQTIYPTDFAPLDPLRVTISESNFNSLSAMTTSPDNSLFNVRLNMVDPHTAHIEFDYLPPKRYIRINILHDGKLSVLGTPKDGKMQPKDIRTEILM